MSERVTERSAFEQLSTAEKARKILEERVPSPEEVIYEPRIEYLDQNGLLTREERAKVIAMGDRTAKSYGRLAEMVLSDRSKPPVEIEGEKMDATSAFYIQYALAARSSKEISHTSILEQLNVGPREFGGDPPIVSEGISILTGLRDICSLRHFGFEAFSSRGSVFPDNYWRIPPELKEAGIATDLGAINKDIYQIYLYLTKKGIEYYIENTPRKEGEKLWQWKWRVLSLALDDSRQVTNCSFLNHFSMHANSGLALREAIIKLSSDELPETVEFASRLASLTKQGLPNLMKHLEASEYTRSLGGKRKEIREEIGLSRTLSLPGILEKSKFLDGNVSPSEAERVFLSAFLTKGSTFDFRTIFAKLEETPDWKVGEMIAKVFDGIDIHDKPPEELEMVQINAHFKMSIGAIFELIRHRLVTHIVGAFTPYDGYTMPEIYARLGLDRAYNEAISLNIKAYNLVKNLGVKYEEVFGPYFSARGFIVPVTIRISGLDVFHFLKIRANRGAHPDISDPARGLASFLKKEKLPIFRHLVLKD